MTDKLRKAAQDVLDAYDSDEGTLLSQIARDDKAMEALRATLAETPEDMPPTCNPHPDAPHGFNRNASHSEDRYVCECEGWEPETPSVDALIAVDDLANIIRTVDGSHTLGAGELAEKIIDAIRARGGV